MDELMKLIKRLGLTRSEIVQEAECVEEYGEWQYIELMGYSSEMLFSAAEKM